MEQLIERIFWWLTWLNEQIWWLTLLNCMLFVIKYSLLVIFLIHTGTCGSKCQWGSECQVAKLYRFCLTNGVEQCTLNFK